MSSVCTCVLVAPFPTSLIADVSRELVRGVVSRLSRLLSLSLEEFLQHTTLVSHPLLRGHSHLSQMEDPFTVATLGLMWFVCP